MNDERLKQIREPYVYLRNLTPEMLAIYQEHHDSIKDKDAQILFRQVLSFAREGAQAYAELQTMRPVVEAAVKWRMDTNAKWAELIDAIDAYRKTQEGANE